MLLEAPYVSDSSAEAPHASSKRHSARARACAHTHVRKKYLSLQRMSHLQKQNMGICISAFIWYSNCIYIFSILNKKLGTGIAPRRRSRDARYPPTRLNPTKFSAASRPSSPIFLFYFLLYFLLYFFLTECKFLNRSVLVVVGSTWVISVDNSVLTRSTVVRNLYP